MRSPSFRERLTQGLLAALLLLPLLMAYLGTGGFSETYSGSVNALDGSETLVSRHWVLLCATGRSLLLALLACFFALLIGVPAAWALAQRSDTRKSGSVRKMWALFLLVCCVLPLVLPASVTVSGWVSLIGPSGAASRFKVPIPGFGAAEFNGNGRSALFSLPGAALVLGSMLWPIITLEVWPAFKRVRNESYDAALLCASPWKVFYRILLPQTRRELAAGGLLVFLLAFSDFAVSSLLLVRTLSTEIHDELMLGRTAGAAAAATPMLLLILIIGILLSRLPTRSFSGSAFAAASTARLPETATGRWSLLILVGGIIYGFVLPILGCLYGALNGHRPMSAVFGAGVDSLGVSIRVAGAAALLAGIIGAARVLFWPETRASVCNFAGLLLIAIPGSFLAAGLLQMQLLISPHLSTTAALARALPAIIFCAGYLLRFIYLPLRLVEEGLASLDPDLLDAAALSGHSRLSRAGSIALPLVLPHLLAATGLVFILSLGDVAMAARLAPPGIQPTTLWLFNQQHMGYDESVFGLSLLLGLVSALTLFGVGAVTLMTLRVFRKS